MTAATAVRTWKMHASRDNKGTLCHIGHERWVRLHGLRDAIVPVLVEELEVSDPRDTAVTHYGWWDVAGPMQKESAEPCMMWPRVGSEDRPDIEPWMLLGVCFAYGIQSAIDHGQGRMVCLRITEAVRHCDDYIDDPATPEPLRVWLEFARSPAHGLLTPKPHPRLFADHDGARVRVTMASRLGDVGITSQFDVDVGYERRVSLGALSNFGVAP